MSLIEDNTRNTYPQNEAQCQHGLETKFHPETLLQSFDTTFTVQSIRANNPAVTDSYRTRWRLHWNCHQDQ